jgi:gliding-associated putative ABC transporter substrate-binding component GldG
MKNVSKYKFLLVVFGLVIVVNLLSSFLFVRLDLTQDKRYTLSETSLNVIKKIDQPLYIKFYMQGNLPAEFKRLQQEGIEMLEEYQVHNSNLIFDYIDPLQEPDDSENGPKELYKKGLIPVNIAVNDKGKQSQSMVFPWAIAYYNNQEVNIPLLKNTMGATTTEKVLASIQNLEYAFTDALSKISTIKQKKVAILRGNGELKERYMAKFLLQTRERYFIAPFTLDSVAQNPNKTLEDLKSYDLAVIVKPSETFSDAEKQVLDQYIVNGGKTLWLIDQVTADIDSLYNPSGTMLAFPKDLGLNDLFFKYGFRINSDIIKDDLGSPIQLATGDPGSNTQFSTFNWKFAPTIFPDITAHPIVQNLGGVKFDFTNSIDTIKNGIKKTILLHTSPYSRKIGTPFQVELSMVAEPTNLEEYTNQGVIPVAVLLEGKFKSGFENRVLEFDQKNYQVEGKPTQMIVISDGDVARNELDKSFQPLELGFDPRTGTVYDNKDLMLNCVNYLLDDIGIIAIRSKTFELPLLDPQKVFSDYSLFQLISIVLPLIALTLFGFAFVFYRKKKYVK